MKIISGLQETIHRGCPYITLADTREGYVEHMAALGYEYVARDDRGFCFRRSS